MSYERNQNKLTEISSKCSMGPIFCVHGEPVDYLRLVEISTTSPVHDLHLPILRSRNVQFSMFNLCMKKVLIVFKNVHLGIFEGSAELEPVFEGGA